MLLLYWTQLLASCGPVGTFRAEEDEARGQRKLALTIQPQDTSPLEVPADTLVPSPSGPSTATTPYVADVTSDGAASVSIPLWTPDGRAGIQPRLALTYNSRGPDGPLGVGFNLVGLSQVTHCPRTLVQDGAAEAVDFSAHWSDALYCLDGERLVVVAASNGEGFPEFRTERESYAKIVITRQDAQGRPRTFRVYTREGRILTFGETATRTDGLLVASTGGPMTWAQTVVEDRAGNQLEVFYEGAPNTAGAGAWFRPDRILYTGFVAPIGSGETDAPARRSVKFRYETRPDVFVGFTAGEKLRRDFRLSGLEMRGPDASGADVLLRSYTLRYDNQSVSKRSLLREVQECDGLGTCKLPVQFDWEKGSWEFEEKDAGNIQETLTGGGLHAFGLGAGRFGIGYLFQSVHVWTEKCGKGQPSPCYLRFPPEQNQPFDRAHWQDVFKLHVLKDPSVDQWEVRSPYADSTWDSITCDPRPALRPVVVDWNGFGKSSLAAHSCRVGEFTTDTGIDILESEYGYRHDNQYDSVWGSSRSVYWLDMDGDGFNDMAYIGSPPSVNSSDRVGVRLHFGSVRLQTASRVFERTDQGIRAVDLEGAGRMSLVGPTESDPTYLSSVSAIQGQSSLVELPTRFKRPFWLGTQYEPPSHSLFDFLDVNGDGLADAVAMGNTGTTYLSRMEVQLNDGMRGFADDTVLQRTPIADPYLDKRTGDFDGDGRTDILLVMLDRSVRILLAGPQGAFSGFKNLPITSGDSLKWVQVVDVNGDGLLDITRRVGNRLKVFVRKHATDVITHVHAGTQRPNGTVAAGLHHRFDYAYLSDKCDPAVTNCDPRVSSRVYTSTVMDDALVRQAPETMRVVRRLSVNDNDDPHGSWTYAYKDGRYHVRGHGWLGFSERSRLDERTGEFTTTTFDNTSYPLCAMPLYGCLPGLAHQPIREVTLTPVHVETGLQEHQRRTVEWKHQVSPLTPGRYQRYVNVVSERLELVKQGQSITPLGETERVTSLDQYGITVFSALRMRDADSTEEVSTLTTGVTFDATQWMPTGAWTSTESWAKCGPTAPETGCGGGDPAWAKVTRITFDSQGRVSLLEREPGSQGAAVAPNVSDLYLKTTLTWGEKGLLTTVTQEGGGESRVESTAYDTVDQVYPRHTVDAVGGVSRFAFHPGMGVLAQAADPNGVRTRYQYDGFGRVRTLVPSYKAPAEVCNRTAVQTHYEWEGSLPRVRTWVVNRDNAPGLACDRPDSLPGEMLTSTVTRLDGLGRPTRTSTLDSTLVQTYEDFQYDAYGNLAAYYLPRAQAEIPESAPALVSSKQDNLRRRLSQELPDQSTTTALYPVAPYRLSTVVTDADGRKTQRTVDHRGVLVESRDGVGTSSEVTTTYQYGAFSRLVGITDATGATITTAFNKLGQPVRTQDPNAGVRLRAFNAFGELKWEADGEDTDAARHVTTLTRDALGRVTQSLTMKGSSVQERATFVWDASSHGFGSLASTTTEVAGSPTVSTVYSYDAVGRQSTLAQQVGTGEILTLTQTFDGRGRLDTLSYPPTSDGRQFKVKYAYTPRGELLSVKNADSNQVYWTALERNVQRQVTRERFGDQVIRTRRYDVVGQLRYLDATSGGTSVQRLIYEYSKGGNLQARHDHVQQSTEQFTYDALDRLDSWTLYQQYSHCVSSTTLFAYDTVGNLLERDVVWGSGTSASYFYSEPGASGGPHAVKRATWGGTQQTFDYDRRGNQTVTRNAQTGAVVRTAEFTLSNLPSLITEGGMDVRMAYDGTGARALKRTTQGGATHEVIYLQGLYQRRDGMTHVYVVPGAEGLVAEVQWTDNISAEQVRYFLMDRLGSPDTVVGSAGEVLERHKYDPFGQRRSSVNLTQDAVAPLSGGRVGYTGHELDDELGLVYMRGRMYDPRLGRFLSPDPVIAGVGSSQAFNAYSYVVNNPMKYTDPTGFYPQSVSSTYSASTTGLGVGFGMAAGFLPWALSKVLGLGASSSMRMRTDDATVSPLRHIDDGGGSVGTQVSESTTPLWQWGSAAEVANAWYSGPRSDYHSWLANEIQPGASTWDYAILAVTTLSVELGAQSMGSLYFGEGIAEGSVAGFEDDVFRALGLALPLARGAKAMHPARAPAPKVIYNAAQTAVAAEAGAAKGGGAWKNISRGIQIRKLGGLWVKRVNPNANPTLQAWGRHSLANQFRALDALDDLATPHSFRNGMLLMQDVGPTASFGRTWLNAYIQGSRRIGWVNDLKPANMGANGRIFDPALDLVDKSILFGGGATSIGGSLYGVGFFEGVW
ncbi:VCBS repeat-containing protein [Myxococcus sp. AM009]|uniref:RHS repeat-associated core domain-containing protein n=1 Tax=Myxococcus sp. AM009 TaxID=2745137 RepID=UPI00159639B0|nr:VCBS repeat-containing protein [Myxococcus sp. AM009]NVJ15580.1 VCBS repeat-containing protein [Myxococcus sp. AM010]